MLFLHCYRHNDSNTVNGKDKCVRQLGQWECLQNPPADSSLWSRIVGESTASNSSEVMGNAVKFRGGKSGRDKEGARRQRRVAQWTRDTSQSSFKYSLPNLLYFQKRRRVLAGPSAGRWWSRDISSLTKKIRLKIGAPLRFLIHRQVCGDR